MLLLASPLPLPCLHCPCFPGLLSSDCSRGSATDPLSMTYFYVSLSLPVSSTHRSMVFKAIWPLASQQTAHIQHVLKPVHRSLLEARSASSPFFGEQWRVIHSDPWAQRLAVSQGSSLFLLCHLPFISFRIVSPISCPNLLPEYLLQFKGSQQWGVMHLIVSLDSVPHAV